MRRSLKTLIAMTALAASSILGATLARAQGVADAEADCRKAKTLTEIGNCARYRLSVAEAELKRVYEAALNTVESDRDRPPVHRRDWQRALREAQGHWRAWVKQDCGPVVAWEMRGGNAATVASTACELERVSQRIEDLRKRYRVR